MTTVLNSGDYINTALLIMLFGGSRYLSGRSAARSTQIECKLDAIISHLGITLPPVSAPGALSSEVQQLVVQGRHVDAIRAYRAATGAGLKEARSAVDDYRKEMISTASG